MMREGVVSASARASADLPLAVGPAMSASGWRSDMFIATLVAPDGLDAGDISAAADAVRGKAGPIVDGVACDIGFSEEELCAPAASSFPGGGRGPDSSLQDWAPAFAGVRRRLEDALP